MTFDHRDATRVTLLQPRNILESISNACTDAQCIDRFDSIVFGGSVRREMAVDGLPLTYLRRTPNIITAFPL